MPDEPIRSRHGWTLRVFHSFEEADRADVQERAAMTPQQAVAELEHIRRTTHGHDTIDARLPRLLEVAQLPRG